MFYQWDVFYGQASNGRQQSRQDRKQNNKKSGKGRNAQTCPCCGYRLRTKPRNLKYKAKLRARVEADSHPERITIEVTQPKIKSIVAKKMVSQTIKVPRKVGRPRKTVEQVVADEPIAVKVPRKVGRPRKTVEPVLVEEAIAINA